MEYLTVEVTGEDIEQGVPGDCVDCPVARALNRALGYAAGTVDVDADEYWLGPQDNEGRPYRLPAAASEFVMAFDSDEAVAPFSFRIRKPKAA